MNNLNIANLATFVQALQSLPVSVRKQKVDMLSVEKPDGKTPNGHEGLVFTVAENIPALKKIQQYHQHQFSSDPDNYHYFTNVRALSEYLGFKRANGNQGLPQWAEDNRAIWGAVNGRLMFTYWGAFTEDADLNEILKGKQAPPSLTNQDLINWWVNVLERVVAES